VMADDPQLTIRLVKKGIKKGPLRVVLDSRLAIPEKAQILKQQKQAQTIVATTPPGGSSPKAERLRAMGAEVWELRKNVHGQVSFPNLIKRLREEGVTSLLIEGGSRVNAAALAAGVVDKVCAVVAPMLLGGGRAIPFIEDLGIQLLRGAIQLHSLKAGKMGRDILLEAYVGKERTR